MKTKYTKLAITLAVMASCSAAAFADGNAFTPLNFDDSTYSTPPAQAAVPKTAPKSQNPISNALSKVLPKDATKDVSQLNAASGEIPIGNDNIQNAILELDNAQVGIRNDLLNFKAKYADADAQYKLIKNERDMLSKQVRSIERRIRNIDKAKEKIRKNML